MISEDIINLKTTELVDKIKKGEITSKELCEVYINRIGRFEKKVCAWAFFDKSKLLEKAEEADTYRSSGKPLGPLHGIPVALKDIIGTYDMPTNCGTKLRKGKSLSQDSEVANLIKNSGAILMGKTVTTELAYFDPGKTKNPHDYTRTPGGSSSGSAAAVASYMAPLAVGTQTNGSVIRPASYCGVVGYKPSYGLISRTGILKQSSFLDQVGVFSRNVEDAAYFSKILIKKDLYDFDTVHYSPDNMMDELDKELEFEPKFIFYKTESWKKISKKNQEIFNYFIKSFKKNIEIFDEPSYFKDILKYHKIIHESDMARSFSDYYRLSKRSLGKNLVKAIERGKKYSAYEYGEAIDFRSRAYESYKEVFDDYYGVITPSSLGVADKGLSSTGSPELSTIWTYMGLPALNLPVLNGENNLPLGLQLIGNKFDDLRFLKYAKWLEHQFDNE
ncbi:MAG: amidase [Candidatus Pelagibacter sp.]|nr:amidase [Candidatus Pelagibacter sp.]OUV87157.1 MAG: amidase [Pelagibacteraceae bacterium TMED136]|tara:strand:+ start:15495 stop:16832 length:1338 start_codon:yes stop_codon:yes gene_type:complete